MISDMPLRWAVIYSLGAAAGAVGFYMIYWPQMLFPVLRGPLPENWPIYLTSQVLVLGVIWATFAASLRGARWQSPVAIALAVAFLASLYPLAVQLAYIGNQYLRWRT